MISKKLFNGIFDNKIIFVTGHTGFIGTWASLWLKLLGSKVVGYSLPPPTTPSLFEIIDMKNHIISLEKDIRDMNSLKSAIEQYKPDFVFHFAAQPLVLPSYQDPVETFQTNVMGTVNILDSIKNSSSVKVCINFTSDKCYANSEDGHAFVENDPMGGSDPYSASKGASELITNAYRQSFFNKNNSENKINLASIRAGNVIGGGDWSNNRIVPDCVRDLLAKRNIRIRHPDAMRPFQHVMEAVSGILWLAACMWKKPMTYNEPWNFGPIESGIKVKKLVEQIIKEWGDGYWEDVSNQGENFHEAKFLKLNCNKVNKKLDWKSTYNIQESIAETISWYKAYRVGSEMMLFTQKQIENYISKAKQSNIKWAES